MGAQILQISDEMLHILKSRSPREVDDQVSLALAIDMFMHGDISLGKAAESAQISLHEMIDQLKERGIPAFVYDENTFREDLEAIEKYQILKDGNQ